jgi:2'-5' RNA ligase
VRLFTAVDLSRDTRDAIAAEQRRVAAALTASRGLLKWVAMERAHLTLVFLGHVAGDAVPPLLAALAHDVDVAPFDVAFGGLGVFPPRGAPRVLWVGIREGLDKLRAVQREIAKRTAAHGIAVEQREFHPHITLGRWTSSMPSDRTRVLAAAQQATLAREQVWRATVYESRLSSSGAVYTALAHANLAGT